jgi:hypothetical protein
MRGAGCLYDPTAHSRRAAPRGLGQGGSATDPDRVTVVEEMKRGAPARRFHIYLFRPLLTA